MIEKEQNLDIVPFNAFFALKVFDIENTSSWKNVGANDKIILNINSSIKTGVFIIATVIIPNTIVKRFWCYQQLH